MHSGIFYAFNFLLTFYSKWYIISFVIEQMFELVEEDTHGQKSVC